MKTIYKVGLAKFKDGQILMARTAKHGPIYINLCGKIEPGESDIDCLIREVREEAAVDVDANSIKFLAEFAAPAYGRPDTLLHAKLYTGSLRGEPTPSSEDPRHLVPIARDQMFPWLKSRGYIR